MREYCFRRDLLRQWAEKVPSLWSAPFLPHLEEELALARQGEIFPAFEFLLPAVDPLDKTLFDYLRGYRIITLEREVLENTLAKQHAELYERFLDRVEAHKPVLAPEQIYVTADELRASLDRFPRLEIEELNVAEAESAPIYFSSQSTRKYHGNIRELIGDLNKFRESGEKIAFVLSNLGRAERMNDILKEYEIPAHLCRSGEQAPAEGLPPAGLVLLGIGNLHAGYYLPAINLARPDQPGSLRRIRCRIGAEENEIQPAPSFHFRFSRPQAGRLCRPCRSRHRPVQRIEDDRPSGRIKGIRAADVSGRRQTVCSGGTAGPDSEIQQHGRNASDAGPAGRHKLGTNKIPHQKIHAGHGGRASEALRAAPDGSGIRLFSRHRLATGI